MQPTPEFTQEAGWIFSLGIAFTAGFIVGALSFWATTLRINNEKKITRSLNQKQIAHHHSN